MPTSELVSKQKADFGCKGVRTEFCCDHVLWFPQLCTALHMSAGHTISHQADPLDPILRFIQSPFNPS